MMSHLMPLMAAMTVSAAMAFMPAAHAADNGLIIEESKHSVAETVARFKAEIEAKAANGWVIFTTIDHAAAAVKAGLEMKPRTVIIFGNPKDGTPAMTRSPMLAIDLPMKALVWQDDDSHVWLACNSGFYLDETIFARHGLRMPLDAPLNLNGDLVRIIKQSTK